VNAPPQTSRWASAAVKAIAVACEARRSSAEINSGGGQGGPPASAARAVASGGFVDVEAHPSAKVAKVANSKPPVAIPGVRDAFATIIHSVNTAGDQLFVERTRKVGLLPNSGSTSRSVGAP
jgi:ABC-type phosphate transport system substrate-binding protein